MVRNCAHNPHLGPRTTAIKGSETADVEKFCLDIQKAYMRFDFDEKDRSSIDHPKKGDLHKQKRKSLYYKAAYRNRGL